MAADRVGVLALVLTTELQEVVPEQQPFVVGADQASRLDEDDPLQLGDPLAVDLEHLVDLLLVLGEVDLGARVTEQVLDLGGRVGRVQTDRDAPHGDGRQVEDDPLRPVLAMDRDPIARCDTERQQPVGGVLDQPPRLLPRVLAPDAEVLLAHRDLLRAALRPSPSQ